MDFVNLMGLAQQKWNKFLTPQNNPNKRQSSYALTDYKIKSPGTPFMNALFGDTGNYAAPPAYSQPAPQHNPVPSGDSPYADSDSVVTSLASQYGLPANIARAIMLAESGGDPNAVGDNGASIGLYQLHERGMGYGMSAEDRKNPWINAGKAIPAIADAYKKALEKQLQDEEMLRFVYDTAINPGGGWAYQGNHVVDKYRSLG